MKKWLSLLLSFLMIVSIISSVTITATAASVDDLTFELNDDGNSYYVAFCDRAATGALVIPSSYKGLPVTDIGKFNDIESCVFVGCKGLTSITIPDSVTSIGYTAFYDTAYYNDDSNWENNVLYVGKHLVGSKSSLSGAYTIKDGTKTIAGGAFEWISGLTSVTIPDGVISIGCRAFYDCRLTSVTIPESVTEIGDLAFGYFWGSGDTKKKNFTIYGAKGSEAENYAQRYNFKFIEVACNHETTKWVIEKEATVNAPGSKYEECTACGVKIQSLQSPQLKCSTPELKTVVNTATGIKLIWNKVTGGDTYTILRKKGNGKWTAIKSGIKNNYFIDKTAKSGVTYKYTVKAKNEAGFSGYNTKGLSVRCLADPTLRTPASIKSGISLKWSKVTGAQGYVIYRKMGNGSYSKIKTEKGISNLSYVDKSAKKGKTYTYKVKAYYGKTYSAYSNAKTIKDKY